jgi:hypothetical protein
MLELAKRGLYRNDPTVLCRGLSIMIPLISIRNSVVRVCSAGWDSAPQKDLARWPAAGTEL